MPELAIARVLHVLGVVLWIGGVAMVTTVLLPATKRIQRAGETPSGVHVYAGDPLALGAARHEPGHGCGRSGRQSRISAVCPMMACRLRVAKNETIIQGGDRRDR